MATEQNELDRLKGDHPFSVPEGYLEGLSDQVMSQLPQKESWKEVRVSMMERVRPWLYMAAVFAGLGLFFNLFLEKDGIREEGDVSEGLIVKTEMSAESALAIQAEEEEEYLEYLETRYADDLLSDEMTNAEDLK